MAHFRIQPEELYDCHNHIPMAPKYLSETAPYSASLDVRRFVTG